MGVWSSGKGSGLEDIESNCPTRGHQGTLHCRLVMLDCSSDMCGQTDCVDILNVVFLLDILRFFVILLIQSQSPCLLPLIHRQVFHTIVTNWAGEK